MPCFGPLCCLDNKLDYCNMILHYGMYCKFVFGQNRMFTVILCAKQNCRKSKINQNMFLYCLVLRFQWAYIPLCTMKNVRTTTLNTILHSAQRFLFFTHAHFITFPIPPKGAPEVDRWGIPKVEGTQKVNRLASFKIKALFCECRFNILIINDFSQSVSCFVCSCIPPVVQ